MASLIQWKCPLKPMPSIPVGSHPGAFGAVRKYDIHTGVDLYTEVGTPVRAVESGVVKSVIPFTGIDADSPWWLPTDAVLVEGTSGVVVYGELTSLIQTGTTVNAGDIIGSVQRVLRTNKLENIEGHLPSMLHLELYEHGTLEPVWWRLHEKRPASLLDPTPFLVEAQPV